MELALELVTGVSGFTAPTVHREDSGAGRPPGLHLRVTAGLCSVPNWVCGLGQASFSPLLSRMSKASHGWKIVTDNPNSSTATMSERLLGFRHGAVHFTHISSFTHSSRGNFRIPIVQTKINRGSEKLTVKGPSQDQIPSPIPKPSSQQVPLNPIITVACPQIRMGHAAVELGGKWQDTALLQHHTGLRIPRLRAFPSSRSPGTATQLTKWGAPSQVSHFPYVVTVCLRLKQDGATVQTGRTVTDKPPLKRGPSGEARTAKYWGRRDHFWTKYYNSHVLMTQQTHRNL